MATIQYLLNQHYWRGIGVKCYHIPSMNYDFAYLHFAGLPPALYDLRADPGETRNLAGDPAYAPVLAERAARLLSHRLSHADRTLAAWRVTPEGLVLES